MKARLAAFEAWRRDLEGIRLHWTVMPYSLVGVPAAAKERTLGLLRGIIEYDSFSCNRNCELIMRKECEWWWSTCSELGGRACRSYNLRDAYAPSSSTRFATRTQ